MLADVALIGGTGIGDVLAREPGQVVCVPTRFGNLRGRIVLMSGVRLLVMHRHASGHKLPPHEVNYRAFAGGLQQLGIRWCLASAAVGSLRSDWAPGTMVACSDFSDLTGRNLTLFSQSVEHTDFSQPFSPAARKALIQAGKMLGHEVKTEGVYINTNGPRYETPHEVNALRTMGDIVGMTAASEAIVMREAGIEYACLAIVSNMAAGFDGSELSHTHVVKQMKESGEVALNILLAASKLLEEQNL